MMTTRESTYQEGTTTALVYGDTKHELSAKTPSSQKTMNI